ncbi:DUF4231 domain-containing protein [Actinoplanes sp. CA-252034]|uniref:DUF4231 domain-containing protein n=1 Tax=Actinoplanes sp. CA-252034 TaxID=3239906 RepID=UPI003D9807E0
MLTTTRKNGEPIPDYVRRTWDWYARRARASRWAHHGLELVNLLMASAIPATLALGLPPAIAAVLGAGVVLCGGLRQIFDWHQNWIRFAQVRSEIEQQVARFGAGLVPYARAEAADRALVASVNDIVQADLAGWAVRTRTRPLPPEAEQPGA